MKAREDKGDTQRGLFKFIHHIKSILYTGIEVGFIVGFLPVRLLTNEYIYVDYLNSAILSIFFFLSFIILSFSHFFSNNALLMKYHCKGLGYWVKCNVIPEKV